MENNQNTDTKQSIPPVNQNMEDRRQQWRNRRGSRIAFAAVVAIIIAIIIFLAGMLVGRATSRHSVHQMGRYGYGHQMQMHSGMNSGMNGMSGMGGGYPSGMQTMPMHSASGSGTANSGTTAPTPTPSMPSTPSSGSTSAQ